MSPIRSFYARHLKPILTIVVTIIVSLSFSAHTHSLPKPFSLEPNALSDDNKGPAFPRPRFQTSNKNDNRKSLHSDAQKRGIGSREAARIAKGHIGGKVLKVQPSGNGHRVKILLPSGKVTYINVSADGKIQ